MRKIVAFAAVAMLSFASVAQAATTLTYDPATGNLKFNNDVGSSLGVVNLESPAGNFIGTPGGGFSNDELPNFTTGFGVPTGLTNIGNVYKPNVAEAAFRADIKASYFVIFASGQPQVFLTDNQIIYNAIPEPATVGLAGLGLIGLAFRRKA